MVPHGCYTWDMTRRLLGTFAVASLLVLSACGSDTSKDSGADASDSPSSPESASPTTSPTEQPSAEPSMGDDELGAIISGDPTDVSWQVGQVPSSWQSLQTDDGVGQWKVGEGCILSMYQPAGLGDAEEPTQKQVLEKYVADAESAAGTTLTISDRGSRMFPVDTGTDATMSTKLSRAHLTGDGGVEGEIYAYRSGDFALALSTLCANDVFAEGDASEFKPFIDQVVVSATY